MMKVKVKVATVGYTGHSQVARNFYNYGWNRNEIQMRKLIQWEGT